MNPIEADNLPVDWFRKTLQHQVIIGDAIRHYVASTFGCTDLASILADSDSTEIASLLELLFYPDTAAQISYEKTWGDCTFSVTQQQRLIDLLTAAPILAPIRTNDAGGPIMVDLPGFVTTSFVQRMNIVWQPPARLLSVIKRRLTEGQRWSTRVRLRNSGVRWHPGQVALLCDFFNTFEAAEKNFDDCFDLLLSMVGELSEHQSPYDFLIAKKLSWFQALCNAEDFERKRHASNMETLMLRGERAVHVNADQLRRRMRLVDILCTRLYGRTEFFQAPLEEAHNILLSGDSRSMQQIVQKLS